MQTEGQTDPKLYFWDVEMDTVSYFNFETGRGEQDDYATAGAVDGQDEEKDTNDAERSARNVFAQKKENKLLPRNNTIVTQPLNSVTYNCIISGQDEEKDTNDERSARNVFAQKR